MNGIVGFENHRVKCIIGINPEERLKEQELLIDLQVEANFSQIAAQDDLTNATCYATIASDCSQIAQQGHYQMLETLAYQLLHQLKEKYQLHWIKIKIKKPSAIPTAAFAFVELEEGVRTGSE